MKRFLALALTLAVSLTMAFSADAGWEPPQGAVNAEAVVLYNVDTDTVVYEKNAHEERAAASLTKMMTGLLLAESGEDLSQTFTIPEGLAAEFDRIQAENGSDADLKIGETVTLESLLYACLLPSGNDAASAIAYYLGNGDMQAFFDKMNARAAELGCENTNFTCAHGLYGLEYGNHSTAWDMFLIARAFRENDLLMEVVTQTGYWMPLTNLHTEAKSADAPAGTAYYVGTTNVMQLPDQALYRPYIRGIKTGFTDEAGRCFASSAESGGMTWLMVVMGAPIQLAEDGFNYAFHTTADLYDWALVNFWPVELPNTETPVASVPVKWCAESETVSLYAASTLTTLQCADSTVEVVAEELPQTLEAPVEAGQAAGRAAVYVDGERVGTVELVTGSACRRSAWLYYKEQLAPFAPVLIGAAVLLALAVLLAAARSAKRRKKAARPR
ncbi:D-alanyl-D-alanine carboxypeptidase family protein [Candidatus Allofournierella merdipullorum]|uniref:D-alanyl-D-alanine carboxypeptidase family protein n=1 Tax=Candidatus Allofournierella merdipullorum TaxID=2838595 RepID=UPI002A89891E|nr:D-alanyl-D-alanine carboxypeptidase [Candidatus Fournierella merdipullorum]